MIGEQGNGKNRGKVVAITDRRTSSGEKESGATEGEQPVYGAPMPIEPPKEADPFDLIQAGRGKTQDFVARRAILQLLKGTNQGLGYMIGLTSELAARDDAMLVYLRRSWLWRVFHRPPVFPPFPPKHGGAEVQPGAQP